MGIKDLWSIMAPFSERKPLYELEGKRVAVDLSGWVCEAQTIADYSVQPRMYLRNLYFRTCYLLLMDVTPVFVLEGKAPELKHKTIAARNAIQFKGAKPKSDGVKTGNDRTRFHHTLKQCAEMLKLLGLACVKGNGEAEALCAQLNANQLVDGIISQDSDCFAYGAQIVYRNFSISQQGAHAAKGGSVDVYDIRKVNGNLDFGRNKIVTLALLCGSDYSDGVHGVGKDSVMKLFEIVSEKDILNRIHSWKLNPTLFKSLEEQISNDYCTSCGHFGKIQSHNKKGCQQCHTSQGCDSSTFKEKRLGIKNEINMRNKAISDPNFPDQELINEFLIGKDNVATLDITWNKPDLVNFIKYTVKFLTWEEVYSFEKFLPILTRWQLRNPEQARKHTTGIVHPKTIKKRRNPKGVPSFEIIWEEPGDFVGVFTPEPDQDLEKLWSTIEPQSLVEQAYPQLVDDFNCSKKKVPRARKTKKSPLEEISDLIGNVSISEPQKKRTKKVTTPEVLGFSSTPKKKDSCFDFNLDQSNFGDENDLDVSDIVEGIIKGQAPQCITDNLQKMGLKLEPLNNSFFINQPMDEDLFQLSFNQYCDSDSD